MARRRAHLAPIVAAIAAAVAALIFTSVDLPRASASGISFWAFDVGQGDASLFIFSDGSTMLVDAGPRKSARSLVAKLRKLGVDRIDILVATHPHEDHIGGVTAVIEAFDVGKVWDSGYDHGSSIQAAMLKAIKAKGIRFGRPKRGFSEEVGGARIEVLAPARELRDTHSDANNNSIIMRVTYGDMSFLMMADAEREERSTVKSFPRSVLLKLAHHGSSNGTDRKLMKQVAPRIAILSYEEGNSYGHPHREVRSLLAVDSSLRALHTPNGDINVTSDGRSYQIEQLR